jgi:TPP-dependent pyruvate/acetoin dehydrogenase alpha subunit
LADPVPGRLLPIDLAGLPRDSLPEWLSTMLLIREFEESLDPLAMAGKIPAGVHLASGQEAVAVGASRALAGSDVVTTGHRPHHHALAKGIPPHLVMAELWGRATGTSGGRGGTMHLADRDRGYFPGNAIVGANVGIAMGAALAAQLGEREQVGCAFFGDGAINTGRTWESLNMAASWKLPLVAVCENNLYAVETYIGDVSGPGTATERALSFGLFAHRIDGQDVGAVYRAVSEARKRALAGDGPTFIEALTYRYHGHSTGDEARYRTEGEVEEWRSTKDPIERLRNALESEDMLGQHEYARRLAEARQTVAEAVRFADASPVPDVAGVADGVYGLRAPARGNPGGR